MEFPKDEVKNKVVWTKGADFTDGSPRYTFEGRDPATTFERFQVVIYTEMERRYAHDPGSLCNHYYYAVGGQLCRYPKFVPEDYVLLKLTPCGYEDNWYRWNQEIPPGSPKELVQAAKEFSGLKIGYRGDLTFRNAEVIDVALFLTEEIVQGESVQTTSELQELLFEHIEREQREYTDSLYRMTQGQLIANAGEIEATRICYNALLTAVFEREQLILLLSNDKPLTSVREAWQAEQAENYDMEFSHTILRFCEDIRQAQQPEMTM